MTGPIRGPDGFPRTDVVQPVPKTGEITKDAPKKEPEKQNTPSAAAEREKARRLLQEALRLRSEDAKQGGHVDETI